MKELIIHQVDIAHYRLIELSQLADQSKPFYDWVEKQAKKVTSSHQSLNDILLKSTVTALKEIILSCYDDINQNKPMLFDGIGRVYKHPKACFYFFSWMIRDAPQQRLSPLISRMRKEVSFLQKKSAEIDTLSTLIYEYKSYVKSFEWLTIREVIIDRLEGSRRSIKGHHIESSIRIALVTAIQTFFVIHGNYGKYKTVEIAPKQIKIGSHTIDVSAKFISNDDIPDVNLLIPIKTRETEGGGHSHLFTRDIMQAISDLENEINHYHIVAVIIAQNWSSTEIVNINNDIDYVFHFKMNPNRFTSFDEDSQIKLNQYIGQMLQ